MRIHRLEPAHAPMYRALMLEAYQKHPDAFTSSFDERQRLSIAWRESRLDHNASPPVFIFGAFLEDRLAGTVGLKFDSREKAKHKSTMFALYAPLMFRNKGIGARLVKFALAEANAHPEIKVVQLTVTSTNLVALALYKECGFTEFGLEPFAVKIGCSFRSKIHMWYNKNPE